MSTTHHVKMAKASQKDIDAAIELHQFLEAMRDGRPASDAVDEFGYEGYGDLLERAALRQAGDTEFLLRAHERGGLFRVAWGMQTLLDPRNEVVDPNLPHLELHPKHEQAAKERDAARAEVAQLRKVLLILDRIVVGGESSNGTEPEEIQPSVEVVVNLRAELAAWRSLGTEGEPVADTVERIGSVLEQHAQLVSSDYEGQLAAEKRPRDELVAIARHVVFEGLTANHEPPYLIPSEKLRERLVELRAAIASQPAAEQPKPPQPEVQPLSRNHMLIDFAQDWTLDGDLLRCRECKSACIASREDEEFVHRSDCKKRRTGAMPWKALVAILMQQPKSAGGV